jgi:cell division inhibitor SepF
MPGAVRRLGAYLGLVEDEYFDEAVEETPARDLRAARHDSRTPERANAVRPVRSSDDVLDRPITVLPSVQDSIGRIVTLQPASFNDSQRIGEAFRSGNPVVMNLTALDRAQAQRVIDFASGLVFGLHGSIQRVTDKVFLLSPRNVDIEVDAAREVAVNAFFNHS